MNGLYLEPGHRRAIARLARHSYPRECCGLLVGRRDPGDGDNAAEHRQVVAVVPTPNAWSLLDGAEIDPLGSAGHSDRDRYAIDPADLLRVQKAAREQGLEILGIYHSHPDHPAVPSECDRALAWPVYSYVIVSVVGGEVVDLQSWRLNDDQCFEPEPVKMIGSSTNKAPFLS